MVSPGRKSAAKRQSSVRPIRDVERSPLGRHGVLRTGDLSQPIQVTVVDLTRDGCGVQSNAPVEPGTAVEIGIANVGRVPATVLWRTATHFGCAFDRPLPPGAVTAALGPNNIVQFPSDAAAAPAPRAAGKLLPRTRLLIIVGTAVSLWGMIGVLVLALS